MKTSNLVAAASAVLGITALGMSSAAYALDQCADANGQNQLVTNTCTVDGNGVNNLPCSQDSGVGGPNDIIFGSAGPDVIKAKEGNDIVVGFGGDDIICLDAGNDFADGGDGNNVIRGGAGNDAVNTGTFFANTSRDFGGSGNDVLVSTFGALISFGQAGNDIQFGDALDDVLQGGAGADFLGGADGNDTLDGGPQSLGTFDVCVGGDGIDQLLNCEVPVP